MQRARRPRKSAIQIQEQQNASHFLVLREEAGEETVVAQMLKKPVNNGSMGKFHRDGNPGQPRVTGKHGNRGDVRKGVEVVTSKDKGESMQESRKVKEDSSHQVRGVGGSNSVLKEKRPSQKCVLESNLEIQRWQEAHLSGKENIKPSESVKWGSKIDDMDTGQNIASENDVGQFEGVGMSLKGVYATPALAN